MQEGKESMIDLFAGAGGLSEGLRQAGFDCYYANEIKKTYCNTYRINHPDTYVDNRDIRYVDAAIIRKKLGLKRGDLSLVAGGPPCQGYSINAPTRSSKDYRNHLFKEFLKFVSEFEPKAVLIENVPGLVSYENGNTLEHIILALEKLGYYSDVRILYAPHYGVPQTRWRTIILGVIKSTDMNSLFPEPLFNAPLKVNFTSKYKGRKIIHMPTNSVVEDYTSVKDAIEDLPFLSNGEIGKKVKDYQIEPKNDFQNEMRVGTKGVINHEASKLGKVNLERLSFIPPGGNWTNIPNQLLPNGMKKARRSDHTKRYGRVHPDGLASTILTKCDPHWGAYFHYNQDRTFTVREAARIQTFPDRFVFFGSKVEQYEQVGNAVPPFLAKSIGENLLSYLQRTSKFDKQVV